MYPLDYAQIEVLSKEVVIVKLNDGSFKQFNIHHHNTVERTILCDDFETVIEY
jgi:hypothetical protein